MNIILIGMNHKTAPLEMRERLSLSCWNDMNPLKELLKDPRIREAMYLSTCNRVEVLADAVDYDHALAHLKSFVFQHGNLTLNEMERCLYIYRDREAVRHLFRVASSLDSLVMGEPQILGQVKQAYHQAVESNATGVILNKVLHQTFRVAKRVRTETGIANNAVSVSYAAVELAKNIFGKLQGKTVLLIGAGEMSELAARHLMSQGIGKCYIANRTFSRAVEMAETFQGTAIPFDTLAEKLGETDIVITSTGATGYVITKDMIAHALRGKNNRLLFLIDIAVPRDIDPEAGGIDNVFLYNIDDLQEVVDDNVENRRQEAARAEAIIDEEVGKYTMWVNSLAVVPTIVSLREKLDYIVVTELERSSWLRGLNEEEKRHVAILATAIVNKIIHDPISSLKRECQEEGGASFLAVLRRMFNLNEEM